MKRSITLRNVLIGIGVALFWLAVWYAAAAKVGEPLLLPSPTLVAERFAALVVTVKFWRTAAVSLLRITAGYLLGVCGGVLAAALCAFSRTFSALVSPLIRAVRAAPVVSFIILMWIWFSADAVPVVISAMMVLPLVWQDVLAGIHATDGDLLEMAHVFAFSPWKKLRHLYLPSVRPYFYASAQAALGLAWKSGITAEVISTPGVAIGRELEAGKVYLETADIFLWTFVVVVLSLLLEKAVRRFFGKRGVRRR